MKLIQGMKLVKELLVKADDLRIKIAAHSAYLSIETPVYPEQTKQVNAWLQAHEDIMQKIGQLRVAIARTNLATPVTIKVGETVVVKTITEWIARRKDLAPLDMKAWQGLTDRNLKEQKLQPTPDSPVTSITIVRCYDPVKRDNRISTYKAEPGLIDSTLEVVNATTDLIES
jgi:hypothetical protein